MHRGQSTSGEPDETLSDGVDEFAGYKLVEILDGPGIPYVLVDPPPVDEPILEGLRIELTPVFAERLGRQLLGEMKKGRGRKSTEASKARPSSSPPYEG